mmetsp:Transcript_18507/g.18207  ORF Transcript_18507/g.18207 Transcript_18507/m.18207 type:complete len:134 (+) Transcript_18507:134-535(+)|eukprot:CAMPEP_0197006082 /NCGR_PEP_ID=MMETSP1380-20130617/32909_1 /TAXON_ID=5936 /ORGANISM="Euplotes crassus, Strain CT5" /LENGTH=133 /DNA_ID=CAMNT_0042425493 /DNA_START=134 /DNA_END=535 /DNA_ORIENTATION=-
MSHDSECDTEEGYITSYQESCDDGYFYQEDCNYDDYYLFADSPWSCQTTESYADLTNTCEQIYSTADDGYQQTTEETCHDSDGGYDHSIETYYNTLAFWDYDYYSSYEYFYVNEDRNISGSCLTDTTQDIQDL